MNGNDGGFLGRWARLKAEARARGEAAAADAADGNDACGERREEAFGPADLPPLEGLGADSDYTAFLAKGVPKALKHAALRRAWATDPAIRAFRTPAEYDWDCNAPGYGRLLPCDDARKLVEAMFRHLRPEQEAGEADAQGEGAPAGEAEGPSSS